MSKNDTSTLKILHDICNLKTIDINEISPEYDYNKSQFVYRVKRINDYLNNCGLPSLLIEGDSISAPFSWEEITQKLGQINQTELVIDSLNSDMRRAAEAMYIYCSDEEVSLIHIQTTFKISKNTVLSDLKEIKNDCIRYGVQLSYSRSKGYYYQGTDADLYGYLMRQSDKMNDSELFVNLAWKIFDEELPFFPQQIARIIANNLEEKKIEYKKEFLGRASCLMVLLALESQERHEIRKKKIDIVRNSFAYEETEYLYEYLYRYFNYQLLESQKEYIAVLICYICNNPVDEYSGNYYETFSEDILSRFFWIMNVQQEADCVLRNRIVSCIRFFDFCHRYSVPIVQPHMLSKKRINGDVYSVVNMIVRSLDRSVSYSEDEISILSEILLEGIEKTKIKSDSAAISDLRIANEKNADLNKCLNYLKVYCDITDPVGLTYLLENLSDAQRKQFIDLLTFPDIRQILDRECIIYKEKCNNWKQAIQQAAAPLISKGYIDQQYVEEMIEGAKERKTYYVVFPYIAMPHSYSKHVKKVSFSMLHLKEPVYIMDDRNYPAKIIVIVAALDNKLHSKALAKIANVLADEEKRNIMLASECAEEIENIIYQ